LHSQAVFNAVWLITISCATRALSRRHFAGGGVLGVCDRWRRRADWLRLAAAASLENRRWRRLATLQANLY